MLALSASAPGLETTERRVNLLGGYGLGGPSVLVDHDWIHLKPLKAAGPVGYRPALGLYGAWYREDEGYFDEPEQYLALGFTTKILSHPDHTGADTYFVFRAGAAYEFAGYEGGRGFGEEAFDWLDLSLALGVDLGRFHGLHPSLELYVFEPHSFLGARVGISIPTMRKLELPAAPPDSDPKGPRYHGSIGAVFTNDGLSAPVSGEKWFGAQVEAGVSILRKTTSQVIFGMRAQAVGANPSDAWDAGRPGARMAAITLAYQRLPEHQPGLGYRLTAGAQVFTRSRLSYGKDNDPVPVFAGTLLVPTRSGFYPFLEIGSLFSSPVVLGVGKSW